MIVNGERALAYITNIDGVSAIDGADNIELAVVGGWRVIVKKGDFVPGDSAVFFEIDSLLPQTEWSEFMRPKKFRVKTMKLNKFGVVSQGLLMPMNILDNPESYSVGDDVTKVLGVTYYEKEDNIRKSKNGDPNAKYKSMCARQKKLSKKKWFKKMMRYEIGRKILFFFFGNKKDNPKSFPSWIKRTDEDRIENMPWMLNIKEPFVVTEKIDGTSTTFFLDCTKSKDVNKAEFGVCSRNVRQKDVDQECYHTDEENGVGNVYWEMAFKYDIEKAMKSIVFIHDVERLVIQGETYGASVQGNPYKMKERRFAAFNLIFDGERLGSVEAKNILDSYNIPFVPILDDAYVIPDNFDDVKKYADGKSVINQDVIREGVVYRSLDGKQSAKNVSTEFLLKQK